MPLDKSELNKLSPEQRIKKLKQLEKELEEDKKKQLLEIDSLIRKSMQEIKTVKLANDIAPRQRDIEISSLFERPNEGERLEKAAREEGQEVKYQAASQMYHDYSQLKKLYGMVSGGTKLSQEQINAINSINERLGAAERYLSDSERLSSVLDNTKQLMYGLRKRTGL